MPSDTPTNEEHPRNDTQYQMLLVMAEMRGELRSIRELVTTQHQHTNQRIDDLKASLDARLLAQEKDIDDLNKAVGNVALKSASAGGATGGLAAVAVELIKMVVQGS